MGRNKSSRRAETVSFIVRCQSQRGTQGTVWRGMVEHVQSGRKAAFQELDQITKAIQELLTSHSVEEGGRGHRTEGK